MSNVISKDLAEKLEGTFIVDGKPVKPKPKQIAWVRAYITNGGNASEAARTAGYSEKTAGSIGTENLQKPLIKLMLAAHQEALRHSFIFTMEQKRSMLGEIAQRCMQAIPVRDNEGNETGEYEFDGMVAIRAIAEDNKMVGHYKEKEFAPANINIFLTKIDMAL